MRKLKIGLFGVGYLGKIHAKCIQLLKKQYEFVGFFDPDDTNANAAIEKFNINRYTNPNELLEVADVIDIVAPTLTHFDLARQAILKGKHLFIEKPVTHTLSEAKALIELVATTDLKIQVGHVERFNPTLSAIKDSLSQPKFIEVHRLANYNQRGTDVSVVLDLMIHDIDILLSIIPAPIDNIQANGVAVISDTLDIANARITFKDGCVANLTASRMSLEPMRKIRLFQNDGYLSLDMLNKKAQVIRIHDEAPKNTSIPLATKSRTKWISIDEPLIAPVNAIQEELSSLAKSIVYGEPIKVSIQDGYKALEVAYAVLEEIEK